MIPMPTAITSTGNVTSTPIGDASMRASRTAPPPVSSVSLVLATRLVDALRRQLERGEEAALAARGVEPDARGPGPQIRRIVGRVRRELVRQRPRGRVAEHDELAAIVLEEVAIAQPQQRARR